MADKSSQLIVEALSRAAAGEAPLHGSRAQCGLFPSTAAGRDAAARCQEAGYLCPRPNTDVPSSKAHKSKNGSRSYSISEKGLAYLFGQVSPKQVLQDLVGALNDREVQLNELLTAVRDSHEQLTGLRAVAEIALRQLMPLDSGNGSAGSLNTLFQSFLQRPNVADLAESAKKDAARQTCDALLQHLDQWQTANRNEDLPLPELYRQSAGERPGLTIGEFHDSLRHLHDEGRIYLHPWTGPLYDMPEPPFALLIGHEVAYYASLRCTKRGQDP